MGGTLLLRRRGAASTLVLGCARHGLRLSRSAALRALDLCLPILMRARAEGLRFEVSDHLAAEFWTDYNRSLLEAAGIPPSLVPEIAQELIRMYWERPSWRPAARLGWLLDKLTAEGLRLGVISNGSSDVRQTLAEWGLVHRFEAVVISAEVGWQKPDVEIFGLAAQAMGLPTRSICHVGDDWENDCVGALEAGCAPVWVSRMDHHDLKRKPVRRIGSLFHLAQLMRSERPDGPGSLL